MTDSVVVTIDGSDRTSLLLADSLEINNMMAAASTASFTVDAGAYTPTAWDEVSIAINGTTAFGGFVVGRTVEGIGPGSSKIARWQVQCSDYTALFDKVLISAAAFGAVTPVSDRSIVQSLFDTYLLADAFDTSSYVNECAYAVAIGFDNMTLRAALDKLAEQVKAKWFVDCQKRVWWFSQYSPPNSAIEIDTVTPDGSTRFDPLPTLQRELDDTTIVNRLRVYGGYVQGGQASQLFTADSTGRQTTFGPLTYRPHSAIIVVVVVGGVTTRSFTGDQIGYVPEHVLYTDGSATNQREVLINRDQLTVQVAPSGSYVGAGASVIVAYYKAQAISATVNDAVSQAAYGRVLEHQVYKPEIVTTADAAAYGLTWLTKYGASQEHVTFEVDVFGLQPGTMLQVNAPTLGVTVPDLGILLQNGDDLLAQNSAYFAQEINGVVGRYVIQSVRYQAIPTPGGVQIRASVEAGEYEHTLLDMLQGVIASQAVPSTTIANQLSDVSAHMGEVVAGRAVLTDGGTAAFSWTNYNAHTGVVVGLQPDNTLPQGNVIVLQGGTVRAKLGYMVGMGSVGTVTPTGWGLWTQNGYFQGQVAASTISGGTISGGVISGGTVSGVTGSFSGTISATAGTIGGFTIEASKLWASAGTIQTGSVVNSSNPGVRMEPAGLFGYGTAGLTFALYSDPALKPWFSSGTISNTVYEVNTAAVIRTGTTNPRVQIDSSGIFAYGPTGTLKFQVDAATGLLTASDGVFAGSVNASRITGGTVSGALVSGGTVSGGVVSGGTVSGALVSGGTVSGGIISGGTVSGSKVSGGTVTGAIVTAGTVSGGTVTGALISGGTVSGGIISGGTVSSGVISSGSVSGNLSMPFHTDILSPTSRVEWTIGGGVKSYMVAGSATGTTNGMLTIYNNGVIKLDASEGVWFPYGVASVLPFTDNYYYLGDNTHGWKGAYFTDQFTGARKLLQINNGTVLIT